MKRTPRCITCGCILTHNSTLCLRCEIKPPPFDQTYVLFNYNNAIKKLIHRYKFQHHLIIRQFFITQWKVFFDQNSFEKPNILLPMPLHKKRLQSRGFNQAHEIAKPLSRYLHIPLSTKHVIRIKNTKPQSTLHGPMRASNIKNAFRVIKPVSAKHIGILDDVMTTGNTITELSHCLKQVGVKKITVFCCSHT